MKGRIVAIVSVFCIAIMIVPCANAGKPDKPPKPPKPPKNPGLTTECIIFSGDLESVDGGTRIVGCCPNAGPNPAYTMTLDVMDIPYGTYDGYLFINQFGTGPNAEYKVQFWTWDSDNNEIPGTGDYFFEIYGGVLDRNRKAKVLTVTVDDEPATVWVYYDGYPDYPATEIPVPSVSFVLVRTSDLTYCE